MSEAYRSHIKPYDRVPIETVMSIMSEAYRSLIKPWYDH